MSSSMCSRVAADGPACGFAPQRQRVPSAPTAARRRHVIVDSIDRASQLASEMLAAFALPPAGRPHASWPHPVGIDGIDPAANEPVHVVKAQSMVGRDHNTENQHKRVASEYRRQRAANITCDGKVKEK